MFKPLTNKQIKDLKNKDSELISENSELVFLLQDVNDAINVGSIFRTADGCSAKVILTGTTPRPHNNKLALASRGLERKVNYSYNKSPEDALKKLKEDGFEIIALELTENSLPYFQYNFKNKVCFILGNEAKGVYKKVLSLVDASVHIPMFGKGPSLNVNVATAIIGYEFLRQNIS